VHAVSLHKRSATYDLCFVFFHIFTICKNCVPHSLFSDIFLDWHSFILPITKKYFLGRCPCRSELWGRTGCGYQSVLFRPQLDLSLAQNGVPIQKENFITKVKNFI
jgi:hypothetical protein